MTEDERKARNVERIATCYPPFGLRIAKIIAALEARGYRPRIDESWRTPAEHAAQLKAGTSTSKYSFHMAVTAAGKPDALAVDLLDDNYPVPGHQHEWPATFRRYVLDLAVEADKLELHTGAVWGLEPDERIAIVNVINGKLDPDAYHGEIGWDPTHIEPLKLTLGQAKAGIRPKFQEA